MELIKVEKLSFRYPGSDTLALNGVSFSLNKKKTLGIIGLNGSGKTTLSFCLCGIIPHYLEGEVSGEVFLHGKDTRSIPLSHFSTEIGVLFQDPNTQLLMPSVEEEVFFPLENLCLSRAEIEARLIRSLDITGISHLRKEDPNGLSGGEKQLVALAAALALDPPILVLDEALSMLDEYAAERILQVITQVKEGGAGLIIVDHTLRSSMIWDHLLVLEEGEMICQGPVSLLTEHEDYLRARHLIY